MPQLLVCTEYGEKRDMNAEGWRAYFTDDEPKEVRTFCPDCAEREFGSKIDGPIAPA